jgi:hypothetical protein
MGADGVALIEYLGHCTEPKDYQIVDGDGNEKSYFFSCRAASRTQFVDFGHAEKLREQYKDQDGNDLFRIIAHYATAASKKKRLELSLPSETGAPDDLPSGFAPREGKRANIAR